MADVKPDVVKHEDESSTIDIKIIGLVSQDYLQIPVSTFLCIFCTD